MQYFIFDLNYISFKNNLECQCKILFEFVYMKIEKWQEEFFFRFLGFEIGFV